MDLIRKSGWQDLNHLIEKMNKLFEEIFSAEKTNRPQIAHGAFIPPMDVYETENELVITAEIPSVRQEDINITIKDNILTLEGERRLERNIQEERYRRIERSYGPFKKSFVLPTYVNRQKVDANLRDGVLYIHLPKKALPKSRDIEIEVKD